MDTLSKQKIPIKYLTLFRKTAGNNDLLNNLPNTGVTKSSNGVVVEGPEYFMDFDLEEEEES